MLILKRFLFSGEIVREKVVYASDFVGGLIGERKHKAKAVLKA